jgi:hypothetical protein
VWVKGLIYPKTSDTLIGDLGFIFESLELVSIKISQRISNPIFKVILNGFY